MSTQNTDESINININEIGMNNDKDEWSIRKEIKEHMEDCKINRSVHFAAFQKYDRKSKNFKALNCLLTILTIIGFMIYRSYESDIIITILSILAILSISISIYAMVYDFNGKSRENWQAAQSYQALYRDCQFYNYKKDIECEYEVAERMRKHLNNLNMTSPSVSTKEYKKILSGM